MPINDWLYYIFQTLYLITAIGMVGVLISENRNPVKSLAWIIVLLFVPFVGVIVYLFFGQDFTRQRMITKRGMRQLEHLLHKHGATSKIDAVREPYRDLVTLLNRNNYAPLYEGNQIKPYIEGESKLEDMVKAIESAEHYIWVEYYIIEDDDFGRTFRDLLIKKAKEGIAVKFIYDDVGCWKVPASFFQPLKDAGVEVIRFLPVKFQILTSKVNYRNHRKMLIIDGKIGFMGGMNIADRYIKGNGNGIWRDTDIRIEGPAILSLQRQYLIDRYFAIKEIPAKPDYLPMTDKIGNSLMQIVGDGPFGLFHPLLQGYLKAFLIARKSIYIQSPYFLPTESLLLALRTAAMSGVDVRIMLPRKSDVVLAHHASRSYIREVLNAGVKVYFYDAGFLHSKLVIIDDYLTIVGSTNMDFRSFEHNFEISSFIYDENEAKRFKNIYLDDQQQSTRITAAYWRKRPLKKRFVNSLLRLFSPLL
ncbi:MAG: cardiolipin synthase [Bacteroidales bacterium]